MPLNVSPPLHLVTPLWSLPRRNAEKASYQNAEIPPPLAPRVGPWRSFCPPSFPGRFGCPREPGPPRPQPPDFPFVGNAAGEPHAP
eukprot:9189585-Pyramimonas_sp.AAC.1